MDPILDRQYKVRKNAIAKCAVAAEEQVTVYLVLRMADGVHPVLQLHRHLTNMGNLTTVELMAKVDLGPIMFIL